MTQRRRVRALHLASCCTLHTYSIGCTASQRNNIVTIHHTSAVNKTSGSFCHPRSSSLAALLHFLSRLFLFSLPFLLSIPLPPYIRARRLSAILFSRRLALQPRIRHVRLLFDFFFPPVLPAVLSPFFARLIFSPLAQPATHPPVYFFYQPFRPVPRPSAFPSVLSLVPSLSLFRTRVPCLCRRGVGKKHPRHEPRRLTFCSFVGHRRY